jgi:hypothetical protein
MRKEKADNRTGEEAINEEYSIHEVSLERGCSRLIEFR